MTAAVNLLDEAGRAEFHYHTFRADIFQLCPEKQVISAKPVILNEVSHESVDSGG